MDWMYRMNFSSGMEMTWRGVLHTSLGECVVVVVVVAVVVVAVVKLLVGVNMHRAGTITTSNIVAFLSSIVPQLLVHTAAPATQFTGWFSVVQPIRFRGTETF